MTVRNLFHAVGWHLKQKRMLFSQMVLICTTGAALWYNYSPSHADITRSHLRYYKNTGEHDKPQSSA